MAVLSEQDKRQRWRELMRRLGEVDNSVSKHGIFDTITALDQWIEDNGADINQAIPTVPRQGLTTKQKALIFFAVADARFRVF